jgi:hypothetical protein
MARTLMIRIVGDSREAEKALQRTADAAASMNAQMAETDQLFRVRAGKGKSLGLVRLAGVGLGAGVAVAAATRSIGELRGALETSGEEAETFSGRMRNLGAAILGGDIVGAVRALSRETANFTAEQAVIIAETPEVIEIIKRMGDEAELAAAAIEAMKKAAATPVVLQLGEARAALTPRRRDDLASLDAQIAQTQKAEAQIESLRHISMSEEEANAALVEVLRRRKVLIDRRDALIEEGNRERREKAERIAKAAERARVAEERMWNAVLKGFGLKSLKAQLTESLDDDIAAYDQLIAAIKRQIKKEGETFALIEALIQARIARKAAIEEQQAAAETAKEEEANKRREAREKMREEARERAEREREARQTRIRQRQERQFRTLGLTAAGEQRVPGVEALRRRLGTLRQQLAGSVMDTPKTRAQLRRISRVLSGEFGKVGRDVRAAILDMFRTISDGLKEGQQDVTVTRFQKRGVEQILAGLGLSAQEIKALRQRLAQQGFGGVVPGRGTAAFGMNVGGGGNVIVHGPLIIQNPRDVDQVVREVQRRGARSAGSRRGTRPGTNRGLG